MLRSLLKHACLLVALSAMPCAFATPVVFDTAWYEEEQAIYDCTELDAPVPAAPEHIAPELELIEITPVSQSAPMPAPSGLATLALAAGYCIIRRRS